MTADGPSTPPSTTAPSVVPVQATGRLSPVRAMVETGGRFMVSPQMDAAAEPFGMKSGAFYFRGRVAALGPVSAEVATSALPGSVVTVPPVPNDGSRAPFGS